MSATSVQQLLLKHWINSKRGGGNMGVCPAALKLFYSFLSSLLRWAECVTVQSAHADCHSLKEMALQVAGTRRVHI